MIFSRRKKILDVKTLNESTEIKIGLLGLELFQKKLTH